MLAADGWKLLDRQLCRFAPNRFSSSEVDTRSSPDAGGSARKSASPPRHAKTARVGDPGLAARLKLSLQNRLRGSPSDVPSAPDADGSARKVGLAALIFRCALNQDALTQ